jgi:hypothetical protein
VPTVAITGTLASGDDVEDRERIRRRRRADHRVDVVLLDELLDVLHGARCVAAVVELDVLDGRAADRFRQSSPVFFCGIPMAGGRAGGRTMRPTFTCAEATRAKADSDSCDADTCEHEEVPCG